MRNKNAMPWLILLFPATLQAQDLRLNEQEYFEARGAEVLVFAGKPGGLFNDAKTGGVELVHHGERTATNGDVRLNRTPEQWDAIAELVERKVDAQRQRIETKMRYPQFDFGCWTSRCPGRWKVAPASTWNSCRWRISARATWPMEKPGCSRAILRR